jgi:hypothetical protein
MYDSMKAIILASSVYICCSIQTFRHGNHGYYIETCYHLTYQPAYEGWSNCCRLLANKNLTGGRMSWIRESLCGGSRQAIVEHSEFWGTGPHSLATASSCSGEWAPLVPGHSRRCALKSHSTPPTPGFPGPGFTHFIKH